MNIEDKVSFRIKSTVIIIVVVFIVAMGIGSLIDHYCDERVTATCIRK